jgi:hypothetical protein
MKKGIKNKRDNYSGGTAGKGGRVLATECFRSQRDIRHGRQ